MSSGRGSRRARVAAAVWRAYDRRPLCWFVDIFEGARVAFERWPLVCLLVAQLVVLVALVAGSHGWWL